jgi:DNA-binding NarL/FixJ family response regulator
VAGDSDCGDPILVVDGDDDARMLVTSAFARAGFRTSEAASGEEALDAAKIHRPRAVILETRLSGVCGYEVCRALRESFGDELAIVFVSGDRTDASDRVAGLLVGADDYIVKPLASDELLVRVRQLLQRTPVSSPTDDRGLTAREVEILGLLAEGLSQAEIAGRLSISSKTVGAHIEHILTKLDCHSRAQAVAKAFREHLVGTAF